MDSAIYIDSDLKPCAYAWPGGYPMFYLSRMGFRDDETGILEFNKHDRCESVTCAECASKVADSDNDLILIASDVNWEDASLYCDVCGERITSAYAEDDATA